MRAHSRPGPWAFPTPSVNCWSRESYISRQTRPSTVRLTMKTKTNEGRFAYEGLDRVIHERARLSVLTSLIANSEPLTFNDLKQMCSLTDGNLSRHLRVLEKAQMVQILK